jgi:hypothetical protein
MCLPKGILLATKPPVHRAVVGDSRSLRIGIPRLIAIRSVFHVHPVILIQARMLEPVLGPSRRRGLQLFLDAL